MTAPTHNGTLAAAIEQAVQTYLTLSAVNGPESAAAFGIACGELMERLNLPLTHAASMLRAELTRRGAA